MFFQRCTGHIFTIEAVFRSQHIESSNVFWEFSGCKVYKEVLGAFSRFLRLTTKLFAMKFRYIFWVIRLQSLQKCFGRIFTIFACKNEAACREVQAHFGGFHFASKKKFWAHFLDFCVQKRRYLPWSSDAFWKFSACNFYRKISGRNFTSCASKNEAVCVHTHFGSPLPCKVYKKSSGRIFSIYSSESEAVCRWVQTHSGRSPLARFAVKSCGRNFTIYVSKNEAVCCEFRRIFDVFALPDW